MTSMKCQSGWACALESVCMLSTGWQNAEPARCPVPAQGGDLHSATTASGQRCSGQPSPWSSCSCSPGGPPSSPSALCSSSCSMSSTRSQVCAQGPNQPPSVPRLPAPLNSSPRFTLHPPVSPGLRRQQLKVDQGASLHMVERLG